MFLLTYLFICLNSFSVNSHAPELIARFRIRVTNMDKVKVGVMVRFRVMGSISVNYNNSGASELTDKYLLSELRIAYEHKF